MICVTDKRIPDYASDALLRLGFDIVRLPPLSSLPAPVASHADLLIFTLGDNLLVRREYLTTANEEISKIAGYGCMNIVITDSTAGEKYPSDVGFCACTAGKYLICREDVTDPILLSLAADNGLETLNVRQGYAKCSCAVTADGSVITSDKGIAESLRKRGVDVLTISAGNVCLPGYDTGFIGGCCGLCGNVLFFVGDLRSHPDHALIEDFCLRHETSIFSLTSQKGLLTEPLFDVGSLFFI